LRFLFKSRCPVLVLPLNPFVARGACYLICRLFLPPPAISFPFSVSSAYSCFWVRSADQPSRFVASSHFWSLVDSSSTVRAARPSGGLLDFSICRSRPAQILLPVYVPGRSSVLDRLSQFLLEALIPTDLYSRSRFPIPAQ
jgi:hypothetical protein